MHAESHFHVTESRAWVRTATHSVIREGEPDFAHFVASGEGYVQRVLRIWLLAPPGAPHRLRAYVGSVTVASACARLRELRRVFRRAEAAARELGCAPAAVRAELHALLRREMPGAGAAADGA